MEQEQHQKSEANNAAQSHLAQKHKQLLQNDYDDETNEITYSDKPEARQPVLNNFPLD